MENALSHKTPMKIPILYNLDRSLRFLRRARPIEHTRVSYSQFGEDLILENLFPNRNDGFYVDVGAHHPSYLSNTRFFYQRGWTGLNIEPTSGGFSQLQRHRPKDINVRVAISSSHSKVRFADAGPLSGIVDENYPHSETEGTITEIEAMPLSAVLDKWLSKNPTPTIDFLSVDCEGHDYEVLLSNDWDRHKPSVTLVEEHKWDVESPIARLMRDLGYVFLARAGLTNIYVQPSLSTL